MLQDPAAHYLFDHGKIDDTSELIELLGRDRDFSGIAVAVIGLARAFVAPECDASHPIPSRCTIAIDFALSFDIVCSQPGSNHASMYAVKEIFLTLQGEGAQTGRPAVFCRFAGCNLWSGREADRAEAVCKFCDTDFVGTDGTKGGKFEKRRGARRRHRRGVAGEDEEHRLSCSPAASLCCRSMPRLFAALHARGFEIAVETNGTSRLRAGSIGSA